MERRTPRFEPRGSEVPVGKWLVSIGATDVRYVGGGEGPPDYIVQFGGHQVAVEVSKMLDGMGWPEEQRIAFEATLRSLLERVMAEVGAPQWHTWCEYDPTTPRPPPAKGPWRKLLAETLRVQGPGGEIQLTPDGLAVGRGVVLLYLPASRSGSFAGVSADEGYYVAATAVRRIVDLMAIKARKVRNGRRAQAYSKWWLVLDEEIVFVHGILGPEWEHVEDGVRRTEGIDLWNKVVLLCSRTGNWRTIHERCGEKTLRVTD